MKKDSWHEVGRLSAVTGTTEQELLDSLMFFDRDNIASVLTGYFSGLVESKELFRAFEFLEHEKIDLFFTDIDSKKLSVLEKLVQVEEDHGRNSDESCKVRKILWKLVDDKYSKTTELAAACEEKRPEEAYGIYSRIEKPKEAKRMAVELFEKDREMAFYILRDDESTQLELLNQIISGDDVDGENWEFAYSQIKKLAGRDHSWMDEEYEQVFVKIAEGAIRESPISAYVSALTLLRKNYRLDSLSERGEKREDIEIEIPQKRKPEELVAFDKYIQICITAQAKIVETLTHNNWDELEKLFTELKLETHSSSRHGIMYDKEGLGLLALKMHGLLKGSEKNRFQGSKNAINAFRTSETTDRSEYIECLLMRTKIEKKETVGRDDHIMLGQNDNLALGLRFLNKKPARAYDHLSALSGNGSNAGQTAQKVMHRLSVVAEEKGKIGIAYRAEIRAKKPKKKRIKYLRRKLVEKRKESPVEFYWNHDAAGIKLFYEQKGNTLSLRDRYSLAKKILEFSDDNSVMTQVREDVIAKDFEYARKLFHFENDQMGLDILKDKFLDQHPELRGIELTVFKLVNLKTYKEKYGSS